MVTLVLDVMVANVQKAEIAESKDKKKETLFEIIKKRGTRGFYLRNMHVVLTLILMKNIVPYVCVLFLKFKNPNL